MTDQSNTYDQEIAEAMHYQRWLDSKSCLKLNNCMTESKRGEDNYDPTQKILATTGCVDTQYKLDNTEGGEGYHCG